VLTLANFVPTPLDRALNTEDETTEDETTQDETPNLVKKRTHSGVVSASKRLRINHPPMNRRKNTRASQRVLRPSCVPTLALALAPVQKRLPEAILSAILSTASLCNCIELIKAWRSQLTRIELASESKDVITRLAASDKRVCLAQKRTWLTTVWTRLAQYDMASDLDSKRQGAIRLDHTVYTKILGEEGLDVTLKARN
jgi:hypothetical protein